MVTTRLSYPESRAALGLAARIGRISFDQLRVAKDELTGYWERLDVIELSEAIASAAGALAERFGLRAGDAFHLAAAAGVAGPDLLFATWGRRPASAAMGSGSP